MLVGEVNSPSLIKKAILLGNGEVWTRIRNQGVYPIRYPPLLLDLALKKDIAELSLTKDTMIRTLEIEVQKKLVQHGV